MSRCKFETYGTQCSSVYTNKYGLCKDHDQKCWCGNIVDHGCPYCGQFVCGIPLCKEHQYCPNHGGQTETVFTKFWKENRCEKDGDFKEWLSLHRPTLCNLFKKLDILKEFEG